MHSVLRAVCPNPRAISIGLRFLRCALVQQAGLRASWMKIRLTKSSGHRSLQPCDCFTRADNCANQALAVVPNIVPQAADLSPLSPAAVSSWGCRPASLSSSAPITCLVKLNHRVRESLILLLACDA